MSVLSLHTRQIDEQAEVVRVLETVLEQARKGYISAVGIAIVRADRVSVTHVFSGTSSAAALIGATDTMKLQMQLQGMNNLQPNPDLSS